MPPPRTGELSASMAVLGLLVERPDVAASVKIRLAQRFPEAHWAPTATDNNLKSLLKQGHVRVVQEGRKPGMSRYEATSSGVAHFREWVRESEVSPLVVRDTVQGRLAFTEPEDLPEMLEGLRLKKKACEHEYAAAHRCVAEARERERLAVGSRETWDAMFMGAKAKDKTKMWGKELERIDELIDSIELLLKLLPAAPSVQEAADG
jgi:DNA-binding PadR family transcriptional regulator